MSLTKSFFPAWLTRKTPAGNNVVISTRIRLARNFSDLLFLPEAGPKEKLRALERVEQFTGGLRAPAMSFQRLRDLDEVRRGVLAERGLVNLDSAAEPREVGLATGPGQNVSLLVNEEDHVRLQVMLEGLNLTQSLKLAMELDEKLGQAFPLASHPEFGFLTACPTNVGTGLRASVMLHLPGLALTRGIVQVLQAVLHIGLAVRGFYGEGTELRSVFFQVSNQVTLGRTEEEIVQHLAGVTRQIVEREEEARQKLLKENPCVLEDKAGRAWGILSGCQLLGFEEALDLLSALRLGVETGVLEGTPHSLLNEMLILIQPAHIQLLADRTLTVEEQMVRRAELVKRHLRIGRKKKN